MKHIIMAAAALGLTAAGSAKEVPARDQSQPQYLRVLTEDDDSVALEIAATRFVPAAGEGPEVTLVGVVHIGDRSYYQRLQEMLGGFDVVLYESVKPAGTGTSVVEGVESQQAATQAGLQFARGLLEEYRTERGEYPADLESLRQFAGERDPRLALFLDEALTDAWGREVRYEPAAEEGGELFRLLSLGDDGEAGGEDAAADIALDRSQDIERLPEDEEDRIQAQLADALRLSFQLNEIDYDHQNWLCSDMSMDELERALRARDLDIAFLEDAVSGAGLPGQIARLLLGFLRFTDALMDGAVSDTVKVVLIELLGDESLVELSLANFEEGFAEVIIDERNQVVVNDLKRLLEDQPDAESVAIFYGAGHMQDLAARLQEQLKYESAESQWLSGIKVDLTRSSISPAQLNQVRAMVRQAIWQMQKAHRPEG